MTANKLAQKRLSDFRYRQAHADRLHQSGKRYRDKLRGEIILHYGGRCACCGEQEIAFLTIDHINNDGKADRVRLLGRNKGGYNFYRKIQQMGYPPGYQVLCWNCNRAKYVYGTCPHQGRLVSPTV